MKTFTVIIALQVSLMSLAHADQKRIQCSSGFVFSSDALVKDASVSVNGDDTKISLKASFNRMKGIISETFSIDKIWRDQSGGVTINTKMAGQGPSSHSMSFMMGGNTIEDTKYIAVWLNRSNSSIFPNLPGIVSGQFLYLSNCSAN